MFGLNNFNGSCWVNAALQAIFRFPHVQARYNAGTYENNNNYQHYIENTNTFNYYTVMVHPANTSSAASWANDNIIHIILE